MRCRVVNLSGAANFRDLGGYPAHGSNTTRWGRIFRSDKLADLTDDDLDRVASCQIGSVVDLRTCEEQQAHPSRWKLPPRALYASTKPDNNDVVDLFVRGISSQEDAHIRMRRFYADLPFRYREEYSRLFETLDGADDATLVHCTAGKDRTGVACALILSALGVERGTIIEDFTLTATLLDVEQRAQRTDQQVGAASQHGLLDSYPPEVRAVLWGAEAHFIESALDTIDNAYGSVDTYLAKELGVDGDRLGRLREQYTIAG